jgi:hypothetical protein
LTVSHLVNTFSVIIITSVRHCSPEPESRIPNSYTLFLQYYLNITLPFTSGTSKWSSLSVF